MKKLTLILLSSILFFTTEVAFADSLYVDTDTAFVPFEYKGKDGKYTGFDIELWVASAFSLIPISERV